MSDIKKVFKFDPDEADKTFYDLSTRIRGINEALNAALDMPCLQQRSLQKALDLLMLVSDNLDKVIEIYDNRQELNFTHLMVYRRKHSDLWPLFMDLLSHAADPSTDETWQEKAVDFCNRIAREVHPDYKPAILCGWIDLITARGLKICRVDKNGEKLPLIPQSVVDAGMSARYAGAHG